MPDSQDPRPADPHVSQEPAREPAQAPVVPRTARANIQQVIALEREFSERRSLSDRIADGIANFVGTVVFVACHLALFIGWAAINTGLIPGLAPFDPFPFIFLCLLVSLEGVLMSTFVLIKQNRMSQRADERAHLDLQINLLTEKEVTKVIEMLERLSQRLDAHGVTDSETRELGRTTAVTDLARELGERMRRDGTEG
ncbi:DUF1003 domain-containing protein [Oleisolibacter albus]|uniref:DUF1003 domain-containing protein n=1 Tax=Oleisolibacter albus TaxID=2171757 RepID=UPI001390690C|nr:DUF1003 domain-containing protein [Oleisolibacter albus]